tara:strand:+ start:376 stop:1554 length:1179 start_codon:yes stop_codon:yes gene_type:complete
MKNKKDIIILYAPPYDQAAQLSKHHFARLWAKDRKVLYVEAPINPASFFTRKKQALTLWNRFRKGPINFSKNLWVTTYFYFMPFVGSRYLLGAKWVNNFNQWLIINALKSQISSLELRNPILFIGGAHADPLLSYFPKNIKVYHCSDDYTLVPSFPKIFGEIEKSLMKKCDLVVTTADELMESKKRNNPNTISVPNGADIHHFFKVQSIKTKIPDDMLKYEKPVIGYIGSVFRWLDIDWIEYASKELPEYQFVFIGPVSIDISQIKKISNIDFLGPRSYSALPGYLKKFDVAVIPFVIDGVTLKASPIKFYEYLASGIPIVSTRLPDLVPFEEYVHLVNDKRDYALKIIEAVNHDNIEMKNKRMDLSKNYSWEARFSFVDKMINNLEKEKYK